MISRVHSEVYTPRGGKTHHEFNFNLKPYAYTSIEFKQGVTFIRLGTLIEVVEGLEGESIQKAVNAFYKQNGHI